MANIPAKVSYEQDVCAWVDRVSSLIREKRFEELNDEDLEHIADEVEDVGKSEQRELANRMVVLLAHLLKWKYQPLRRGSSWELTIKNQRQEIKDDLVDTPSLKTRLSDEEWIRRVWRNAVYEATRETALTDFPNSMPWTFEQALDDTFLPD